MNKFKECGDGDLDCRTLDICVSKKPVLDSVISGYDSV